jgi:hypothetical protein
MTIIAALRTLALADSTVLSQATGGISMDIVPEGTGRPCIVLSRISGTRVHHMLGASGLAYGRFQFSILAATYSAAATLADALRNALDGYKGTPAGTGVKIESILIDQEADLSFIDPTQETQSEFGIRQDYIVGYAE